MNCLCSHLNLLSLWGYLIPWYPAGFWGNSLLVYISPSWTSNNAVLSRRVSQSCSSGWMFRWSKSFDVREITKVTYFTASLVVILAPRMVWVEKLGAGQHFLSLSLSLPLPLSLSLSLQVASWHGYLGFIIELWPQGSWTSHIMAAYPHPLSSEHQDAKAKAPKFLQSSLRSHAVSSILHSMDQNSHRACLNSEGREP